MSVEREKTASGGAASIGWPAAVDVAAVLVFALVGRASHSEGALGLFGTAWPFLSGLAVGWVAMRAWRHPRNIVWTGLGIWVATVAGGLLLRVASGQTAQLPFVLVATATLGVLLLGWRALSALIIRARRSTS